jgi:hypothetical protein
MSETTGTPTNDTTEAPRPIIQLLEQSDDAGGCCGGGSCGI